MTPKFLNPARFPLIQTRLAHRWGDANVGCYSDGWNPELFLSGVGHLLSTADPHRLPSSIAREDEHLLVAAAKKGDTAAFEELVNRYESKIFRLTMNITANREDAED